MRIQYDMSREPIDIPRRSIMNRPSNPNARPTVYAGRSPAQNRHLDRECKSCRRPLADHMSEVSDARQGIYRESRMRCPDGMGSFRPVEVASVLPPTASTASKLSATARLRARVRLRAYDAWESLMTWLERKLEPWL
jgi:hypothetical protein